MNAVDWGGIERITGGTHAFVNFTEQLIIDEVAAMYPKEHLIVEVLENVEITPAILDALRALKDKGYIIAADDYEYQGNNRALLELSDIVKVEVDGSAKGWHNLERVSAAIDHSRCRILAEKVETEEIVAQAKVMGCSLFQGYYFAKPKLVMEKTINPMRSNQIRLMREIAKPDADFAALAEIIKQDLGLSARTLRLVNSAYYGPENEVKNITQAVALLGENEMRRWIIYTSLNDMCDNKPAELVVMSMVRARFCELVAKATKRGRDAEAYFLAGLFSLLDVLTDTGLEQCLSRMRMPKKTKAILLNQDTDDRMVLDLIIAMENSDWAQVSALCGRLGLREDAVSDIYMDAIQWAQQF
ncbi:MAG: HDOD domain-containing protein [Ruminococcaceae bacterium]|nr:HDOD domain-containing protein [Oscillospiraceae bacterium]